MRVSPEYHRSGYFWLPSNPAKRVPGELTVADGGRVSLEVIDLFEDLPAAFSDDLAIGQIVGQVESDGPVTLDDCWYERQSFGFGRPARSKVRAKHLLVGIAAEDRPCVLQFDSIYFSLEGLDEWVGTSGIEWRHDASSGATTITYTPLTNISVSVDDVTMLGISFDFRIPSFGSRKEAHVISQTRFHVSSSYRRSLSDLISLTFRLANFLCFATDQTRTISNVMVTSSSVTHDYGDGRERAMPIKLFYESIPSSDLSSTATARDMLFTYPMVSDELGSIVGSWLRAYQELGPAMNLYFAARTNAHRYIEGRFLALIQAIECFHRRTANEKWLGDEDYADLTEAILGRIPNEYREKLAGRLKYGNELPLATRVRRMVGPFSTYFGSEGERREFISSVVNTRDYHTHYDDTLRTRAVLGGEGLWRLCNKLEGLLQLHILLWLGFSHERVASMVAPDSRLHRKLTNG